MATTCEPIERASPSERLPTLEVADIFRDHGEAYRATHALSRPQALAVWSIIHCRTATLGGHLERCDSCDFERPAYNSCNNRHCPKCQALRQHQWVESRKRRILPVGHFHVVFTLPSELRSIALANACAVYNALFRTAADTLADFGKDKRRLGAQLGVTAVLVGF